MKSICMEAEEITNGERRRDYGHPSDNLALIASLWNARFGMDLSETDIIEAMILLKIARNANTPKRDNFVDTAGYANLYGMLYEEPTGE